MHFNIFYKQLQGAITFTRPSFDNLLDGSTASNARHFEDLYGIKTYYQRLSTGEVQAKNTEEAGDPSADVWFGGTILRIKN